MSEIQSPLMAFRVAEPVAPVSREGHYDPTQQVWVGDTLAARNLPTSTSTLLYVGSSLVYDSAAD